MADETARKMTIRRFYDPHDESLFVDVPIIKEITFLDMHDDAQETTIFIDNSRDPQRKVRIETITIPGDPSADPPVPDYDLKIERVETWAWVDMHEYAQETQPSHWGNLEEPPKHSKTHKYKIENPDNKLCTATVQRADKVFWIDMHDYAQETEWSLDWGDDTCPEAAGIDEDGADHEPYRLDPYQDVLELTFGKPGKPHPSPPPPPPVPVPQPFSYFMSLSGAGCIRFNAITPPPLCGGTLIKGNLNNFSGNTTPGSQFYEFTLSGPNLSPFPEFPTDVTIRSLTGATDPPPYAYEGCSARIDWVLSDRTDGSPTDDPSQYFDYTITVSPA